MNSECLPARESIRYLLINTPLTDPTEPYHSIPYLVGATSAVGYTNVTCLDANIEALNFLAQREQVESLLRTCSQVRESIEEKTRLTRREQILYRYALQAVGFTATAVSEAIAVLQDPERFYDYSLYSQAVRVLLRWLDILSVRGIPGQFKNFILDTFGSGNICSTNDLKDREYIDRLVGPLVAYFDGPFRDRIASEPWDFIALSVNYTFQLPFAIWMVRRIRALAPGAVVCVGGTEISDVVKYATTTSAVWRLLPDCDAIMAGEGESAMIAILEAIRQGRPLPGSCPGVLLRDAAEPDRSPGGFAHIKTPVMYEDISRLPSPRYDVWDWHRYWSPEPVVLYSPTRGCYWNKCTFCDYGLNSNSPTSPSRERPVELAVEELRQINRFAKTVYFAVDAMSPAYLQELARAIQAAGLRIHWSAELRLEKRLQSELAVELRDAGCVCISFGYESGSQRILNLINKGVNLKLVPEIFRQLHAVGIGAQIMGFVGFPGEKPEEALETYDFLLANRSNWTLAGIGDFVLTSGAIVAKQPQAFGVRNIAGFEGDDILRILSWQDESGRIRIPGDARDERLEAKSKQLNLLPSDRPFLGGTDTAHTLLYFARYGPELVPAALRTEKPSQVLLGATRYRTPHVGFESFLTRKQISQHLRCSYSQGRSVGYREIEQWLDGYTDHTPAQKCSPLTLTIQPSGKCSPSKPLSELLLLSKTPELAAVSGG